MPGTIVLDEAKGHKKVMKSPILASGTDSQTATAAPATQEGEASKHRRIASLDLLKLLAVFAVIFIHLPASDLPRQVCNQLARFAVPCFFIVSGYLFASSSATGRSAIENRIKRIMVPFLAWALFYAIVPPYITFGRSAALQTLGGHFHQILADPIRFLLTGNAYHLWFLSSLVQGICLLWLFRSYANVKIGLAFGALLLGVALVADPYGALLLHHAWRLQAGPFLSTFFIMLGAHFAESKVTGKPAAAGLLIGGGLLLHWMEVLFLQRYGGTPFYQQKLVFGTVLYAVGIFLLFLSHPAWGRGSALAKCGTVSLGIYAIHPYVMECLHRLVSFVPIIANGAVAVPAIFILSLAIALLFARVPGIRRLVA